MRVLLLDNFDSFTFNIVHYLEGLDCDVKVTDNQKIHFSDLEACDCLVISPGPGLPEESGKLLEMIGVAVKKRLPVLGVCLGMQAIAEHFGGKLFNQQEVKHGKQETINVISESILFNGVPQRFKVGLYHSWAVEKKLPEDLIETAVSECGVMMALEHTEFPVYGVQFHPESIMSEYGKELFANFLKSV